MAKKIKNRIAPLGCALARLLAPQGARLDALFRGIAHSRVCMKMEPGLGMELLPPLVISRTATEYLLSLVILFTLYTVTQVTAGGAGIKTDQQSTLRELRGQRTAFTLVHPRQ